MTETVGFAWWMPSNGGSQQAYIGNYNGLDEAGFHVEAYTNQSITSMIDRAEEFDWCFIPFVFDPEIVGALSEKTWVHLQIGGYGRNDWDAATEAIDLADSLSVLDPQLAIAFDVPYATWIPNPPNVRMFDRAYRKRSESDGEYVLIPKLHESGTLGKARGIVEKNPDETFLLLGSTIQDCPPNVVIRPKTPLTWMPEVYAKAKAVINPKEKEGLPNVAYESFISGVPYVPLHVEGIGRSQATQKPLISEVGTPAANLSWNMNTNHWAATYEDADREVGEQGRDWIGEWWESGWRWADKFEAVRSEVSLSR